MRKQTIMHCKKVVEYLKDDADVLDKDGKNRWRENYPKQNVEYKSEISGSKIENMVYRKIVDWSL